MMLLSCDVKVATRRPKYIHARAGMEQGSRRAGRQAGLTAGFSSAVGLLDEMNRFHASTPARSGSGTVAGEVT